MSKFPSRRQTEQNPLIASESQYRCCVPDCRAFGVWSPYLHGSLWYCRQHAGLPEPSPRVQLAPSDTAALMRSIFGQAASRPDDPELEAERAAIQSEGEPL
jgi:hypothetical protein